MTSFYFKISIFYKKFLPLIITITITEAMYGQQTARCKCANDTAIIYNDLFNIVSTSGYRNFKNTPALNQTAKYIHDELQKVCDTVYNQHFTVDSTGYKNVIGIFGAQNKKILVIGAHYDVCGNQQGTDDNASGVAAVITLARKLKNQKLNFQIQFVAYTLEEPPYFRTKNMGSYVHANSLKQQLAEVMGMICFDMIGYYSDARSSQQFPLKLMKIFYGNKGNFITINQQFGNGPFGRKVNRYIKQNACMKTKSLKSPAKVKGVDFSDHLNYIKMGYPAVFITNTAFYRNKNYHQPSDTLGTLNLLKICFVIEEVHAAILKLNQKQKIK